MIPSFFWEKLTPQSFSEYAANCAKINTFGKLDFNFPSKLMLSLSITLDTNIYRSFDINWPKKTSRFRSTLFALRATKILNLRVIRRCVASNSFRLVSWNHLSVKINNHWLIFNVIRPVTLVHLSDPFILRNRVRNELSLRRCFLFVTLALLLMAPRLGPEFW